MEIRAFAESVLYSADLATKLADPGPVTDAAPGAPVDVPAGPGREDRLALRSAHRPRATFPRASALAKAHKRGEALHFFANHELLALELMALVLLRFPDAPAAFRRGLVQTMRDEQRHLSLYLARMEALGVGFGDLALNAYFWDTLSGVQSPAHFAAQMSLGFEQANLDFTGHYLRLFQAVDDQETVRVLEQVLADEIRHVKHGAVWFDRWRAPGVDLWDAWVAHLGSPLTPARAKGPVFEAQARREAGLPDAYIERLRVFAHSKGRPPDVHLMNPSCEDQIATPGRTPTRTITALEADLETLPMTLTAEDDVVLVRRPPRLAYLTSLQDHGFRLPEFIEAPLDAPTLPDDHMLHQRLLGRLRPWGWSLPVATRFSGLGLGAGPTDRDGWERAWRKDWAAAQLAAYLDSAPAPDGICDPVDVPRSCGSDDEVARALDALASTGLPRAMVKAPLGTSGRGNRQVPSGEVSETDWRWIRGRLKDQGAVLVSPFRTRALDLSVQLQVLDDGRTKIVGISHFATDGPGRYRGAFLGRWVSELPEPIRRFMHDEGRRRGWVRQALEDAARQVGGALFDLGHRGPAGIDAMIFRDGAQRLRLQPMLEVNPRVTMGRLALSLEGHVSQRAYGCWRFLTTAEVTRAGHGGFPSLVATLSDALPRRAAHEGRPGTLRQGVVATNDPERAAQCLTLLAVAPTREALDEAFADAGLTPLAGPI